MVKSKFYERDSFSIIVMIGVIVGFCSKVLFTDKIIRASDVITQFFWTARGAKDQTVLQYLQSLPTIFHASWEPLADGGRTLEGGWNAIGLLFHRYLIMHFFPFPASIAWLAVFAMCWGAAGTFKYCRLFGIGRLGSSVAGLLFVLCTENLSLINAGHIQKLEAICWFPWILFALEKGLRSGRVFHYLLAAMVLAIQFFHMHWQISFYSCLAVGAYFCFHAGAHFLSERRQYAAAFRRDILLAGLLVLFFFTTIAMSFAPLYSWSAQSERGKAAASASAKNSGRGGIGFDEGMSWSMPPEEMLTFFVPGLMGLSRQEEGDVAPRGEAYYWGRMRFTQTNDYLGLLPWFLLPLPLIFRRDRLAWFCTFLMAATLVMALGKYTFVYRFMFEHLPGFSSFRVPKMILFLFAFGAAVLAGRGVDILAGEEADRRRLGRWLWGCGAGVLLLGLLWLLLSVGERAVVSFFGEFIGAPTRYQSGPQLEGERYSFMVRQAGIGFALASIHLAILLAWFRRLVPPRIILPALAVLLLGDLWSVNRRFLVVTNPPPLERKAAKNDVVRFLEPRIDHFRMQPFNGENAHYYADFGFPNVSAYVTVSERRYKEFLDGFSLMGGMPDIMNLKYLLLPEADYQAQKGSLDGKYIPVFADGKGTVVLENRTVLPKAWLVPSVAVIPDGMQQIGIMSTAPEFNPAQVALVESAPPLPLPPFPASPAGAARVQTYEPNRIVVEANAAANALLVLGEKYYRWWYAYVDGKKSEIVPVDHILRGVYLPAGTHRVEFVFDPLPFKVGKWLTLASFGFFAVLLGREWREKRRGRSEG